MVDGPFDLGFVNGDGQVGDAFDFVRENWRTRPVGKSIDGMQIEGRLQRIADAWGADADASHKIFHSANSWDYLFTSQQREMIFRYLGYIVDTVDRQSKDPP
jgi:hypothetical protein